MPISVRCPTCDGVLPVPDELAGQTVRCGGCGQPVSVPRPDAPPPAAPLPLARRVTPTLKRAGPPPRPRRRPRKPPAVSLSLAGRVWLGLLAAAGVCGLGTVLYAAVGGPGTPDRPSTSTRPPDRPPRPADPLPAAQPPPLPQFEPPAERPRAFADPFGGPAEPRTVRQNSNELVRRFVGQLRVSASSQWTDWPAGKLVDGEEQTSWFAQQHDQQPVWIELAFPEDTAVRRVTLLGNREPQYPQGYTVYAGTLQLRDANGRVLASAKLTGVGPRSDFEWEPKGGSLAGVRTLRFTVTRADTPTGPSLAEVQVE